MNRGLPPPDNRSLCPRLNLLNPPLPPPNKIPGYATDRTELHAGILVEKLDRSSALGRPGHIWEDNIKMDLKSIGWGGVNWIDLDHDRNN